MIIFFFFFFFFFVIIIIIVTIIITLSSSKGNNGEKTFAPINSEIRNLECSKLKGNHFRNCERINYKIIDRE